MALMGSKTAARVTAVRAGVPVVAGTDGALGPDTSDAEIARVADAIGYPLLVKAVAGGGGKGMRTVVDAADLAGAVRAARSEAGSAFGDASVYSSGGSPVRDTWRCSCSAITMATCCRWSNVSVPCSGATRRSSRKARRWRSLRNCVVQ